MFSDWWNNVIFRESVQIPILRGSCKTKQRRLNN